MKASNRINSAQRHVSVPINTFSYETDRYLARREKVVANHWL